MPTYHAIGVTASLGTCDLQASLPNISTFKQGSELRGGLGRLHRVFATAAKLPERPIGENGSERGVIQFLGINADIPFYMVETGYNLARLKDLSHDTEMLEVADDAPVVPLIERPLPSDDSPLTSLGATPTPTKLNFTGSPIPIRQPALVQPPRELNESMEPNIDTPDGRLQTARSLLGSSGKQALVLNLELSRKSFLDAERKTASGGSSSCGDIKIEIFVNGRLANVGFQTGRSATQIDGAQLHYSGTRIHRQIEKPWIYSHEVTDQGDLQFEAEDSERRWYNVSASYVREAEMRGRNRLGALPPSAEFLMALANVELPERIKGRQGIGLVDVVITAGSGRKHGPETAYLMKPERMADQGYTPQDLPPFIVPGTDNQLERVEALDIDVSNVEVQNIEPISPSIERSQQRVSNKSANKSRRSEETVDLAKELGFEIAPDMIIEDFENSRGKKSKAGRTLQQRLGDVKKMTPQKRKEELARIKDEIALKTSPSKKAKIGHNTELGSASFSATTPFDVATTVDPVKLLKHPPPLPEDVGLRSILEESATGINLVEQAENGCPLPDTRISLPPPSTPRKKTRASALAGSPAAVPVKSQPLKHTVPMTPECSKLAPAGLSANHDASPSRSGRGANRTARLWDPEEPTPSTAVESFAMPTGSKGSCVTYDAHDTSKRLVGKVRGGDFSEQTLLVGMRFVVS